MEENNNIPVNWAPFRVKGVWLKGTDGSSWIFKVDNQPDRVIGVVKTSLTKADSYYLESEGQLKWINSFDNLEEAMVTIQNVYSDEIMNTLKSAIPGFNFYPATTNEVKHV